MGIFKDLKNRRLVQIVVGYLAAGWIGLEVIDQLIDNDILPRFLYTVALVWYIGGFFVAMLVGWFHGEKGRQKAPMSEVLGMVVVAMVVLSFTGFATFENVGRQRALEAAEASALDLDRIAVPYFTDLTPGGALAHIADGFTEALIDELSTVDDLDVLSRGAVAPFRGDRAALDSLGRALEAGTVVDGTIDQVGGDIRVVVRLLEGQSGVQFSRAEVAVPEAELLDGRQAVVEETARQLRPLLGRELKLRSTRSATENLAAWTLYQRAEKSRKEAESALFGEGLEAVIDRFDRSDSLLVQAMFVDSSWVEPVNLWAHNAYRRARLATDLPTALEWVDTGLERVERALELDARNSKAYETRGTLKYFHWLLGVIPDEELSDAKFREARADLEKAVDLDSGLASAHSVLSHLYLNAPDFAAAVLAGRKAYQEDAYLEDADRVIWRIATANYNLGQHREMSRWCRTGRERFPADSRFPACELQAMTTPTVEPDVPYAWRLLAAVDSLAPANQAEWEVLRAEIAVGGVLAREGMPDSAAAVLDRAHMRITAEVDPNRQLYMLEAQMRDLLGDQEEAIELLKLYAAANPGTSFDEDGWWRSLRSHPRWRELSAES